MKPPTREQVITYAAALGIAPTPAATYWAHGDSTGWTMRDGAKVRDWEACFRLWVERMQGRPGFEIVLHDQPHENHKRVMYKQRQAAAFRRDDIIRQGRKSGATDERIGEVLVKHGVSW